MFEETKFIGTGLWGLSLRSHEPLWRRNTKGIETERALLPLRDITF
jgi:hypothetical protein